MGTKDYGVEIFPRDPNGNAYFLFNLTEDLVRNIYVWGGGGYLGGGGYVPHYIFEGGCVPHYTPKT